MASAQEKQCACRPTANWEPHPSLIHRAAFKRTEHAPLCTHTAEEKVNSTRAASSIGGEWALTSGHKLSALEIEETLREHPAVAECAVVGVPDLEWGERVAAAVVLNDGGALDLPSLRAWAKEFLAAYKLPSRLLVLDALPRNAMGKVTKPAIKAMFQSRGGSD